MRRAGSWRRKAEETCRPNRQRSPATPSLRRAPPAKAHFRTLLLGSPFQPRLEALKLHRGLVRLGRHKAPNALWDEELEYFAIRSQAAIFDISPMVKYRIEGPRCRGLPRSPHPARRDQAEARPRPLHRLVRRRRPCARRRHAVPPFAKRASGCAARSGTCHGCSTAPSASTSTSRKKPTRVAALALQGPTALSVLDAAGFAGFERLKPFDLAEFSA